MDELLMSEIDRARQAGALFFLKWDGERSARVYTVFLEHRGIGFMFRADTDDMFTTARECLRQFWEAKSKIEE